MELTLFEVILKALSEIRILLISRRKKKEKIFNSVEMIQEAALKTKHYYATKKTKREKPNIELSEAWINAARTVRDLDSYLYMRLLAKAEFWANPSLWTSTKMEQKNIYLNEILEDSKRILRKEIKIKER